MKQNVKTTIKWIDDEGNLVGAYRDTIINLPSWGKLDFLRNEVVDLILSLCVESYSILKPLKFSDFALQTFKCKNIVMIKSITDGSKLVLKDEKLKDFINSRVLK